MGDIEYLNAIEFGAIAGGTLRKDEDTVVNTTGDLGLLTADTGNDLYLSKASCSISRTGSGVAAADPVVVELLANGVVLESFRWNVLNDVANTEYNSGFYEFIFGI